MVEADLLGFTRPSIRQMFDHCYYARAIEPGQIWQEDIDVFQLGAYSGPIAPQLAYGQALEILNEGRYFDSHCWIVTPLSFLDLLYGASAQNLFSYIPISIEPTGQGEFEFFISLQNTDPAMDLAARREEQLAAIGKLRDELKHQQRTARLLAE